MAKRPSISGLRRFAALWGLADYEAWGSRSLPYDAQSVLTALPAGLTLREGFTGQEDQEAEFGFQATDHGARFYPPALRRWFIPDPKAWDQPGLSPYAYCNNDPLNLVDPEGEDPIYTTKFGGRVIWIGDDGNMDGKESLMQVTWEDFIKMGEQKK